MIYRIRRVFLGAILPIFVVYALFFSFYLSPSIISLSSFFVTSFIFILVSGIIFTAPVSSLFFEYFISPVFKNDFHAVILGGVLGLLSQYVMEFSINQFLESQWRFNSEILVLFSTNFFPLGFFIGMFVAWLLRKDFRTFPPRKGVVSAFFASPRMNRLLLGVILPAPMALLFTPIVIVSIALAYAYGDYYTVILRIVEEERDFFLMPLVHSWYAVIFISIIFSIAMESVINPFFRSGIFSVIFGSSLFCLMISAVYLYVAGAYSGPVVYWAGSFYVYGIWLLSTLAISLLLWMDFRKEAGSRGHVT